MMTIVMVMTTKEAAKTIDNFQEEEKKVSRGCDSSKIKKIGLMLTTDANE
jgi:hypothetical protein